jgi:hypothetical protein
MNDTPNIYAFITMLDSINLLCGQFDAGNVVTSFEPSKRRGFHTRSRLHGIAELHAQGRKTGSLYCHILFSFLPLICGKNSTKKAFFKAFSVENYDVL